MVWHLTIHFQLESKLLKSTFFEIFNNHLRKQVRLTHLVARPLADSATQLSTRVRNLKKPNNNLATKSVMIQIVI